jgi:hypothetical protein
LAKSPSHKFGQVVGNLLEEILLPVLKEFCDERGLYLDRHGERVKVRRGKKVSWEDKYGNPHDLDFVLEKGGSASVRGRPVAFIEAAWRSYAKHSKNKAQEIQGAIVPIAEKHERDFPFLGAVLAGVFTKPSLDQLRSHGFDVVYLPYKDVISAFGKVGIEIKFDEGTPDHDFAVNVAKIQQLDPKRKAKLKSGLLSIGDEAFRQFFNRLRRKLHRIVERVVVLPLFGAPISFATVTKASEFLDEFDQTFTDAKFQKYELSVLFSNNDEIRGVFASKEHAKEFLDYVASA